MKYSKQRQLILKTLEKNVVHPTAEYIYELVKKELPTISLATVYRNLNLLADNKIIKKIDGLSDSTHYDHNTHKHYHFLCTKCNKIFDIDEATIGNIVNKVEENTNFKITQHEVSLKGICHECQTQH